jgi:UDP-N-acetylglucosamine--N-acetylmuramyl-(pentapeptide) pyrophosphoryl-undecaprenol N-acetylglucosamine transferase
VQIVFVGQRGDRFGDLVADDPHIAASYRILAGKFRRYHGEGLKQLRDVRMGLLNLRDLLYFLLGTLQSVALMRRVRPDVVFVKGGFVGVPVGLAAAFWRIPFVTHDSDAIPGLANRIIARWASLHAVALPAALYKSYPSNKTVTTGVPIASEYAHVTPATRREFRKQLGLPEQGKVLLVTGGGQGARTINNAVTAEATALLKAFPDLIIVHAAGQHLFAEVDHAYATLTTTERSRVQAMPFAKDLWRYSGAADVVLTRASATSVAELAAQGVATIVVPSPFLAGGHQLRNAESLEGQQAVKVLQEHELRDTPELLKETISELLSNDKERTELGKRLYALANPRAAHDLAVLLLELKTKR